MSGPVTLRPAGEADCELVFGWANDPATRAMSFNTAAISHEEHLRWFRTSLQGARRLLFIAEDGAGPIGVVRLSIDEDEPHRAEIGINLAPERRGQGRARPVLERASVTAAERGLSRLVARIRPENSASQRAFEGAGYRLAGREAVASGSALRYEIELSNRR
jgi:RimJ/RimL family protein N-acetyltransferase